MPDTPRASVVYGRAQAGKSGLLIGRADRGGEGQSAGGTGATAAAAGTRFLGIGEEEAEPSGSPPREAYAD